MTVNQNITISKSRVMDEVAKTTAYIGSKATGAQDSGAYDRIATTDANREQLDRYWMEACSGASSVLVHWLTTVASQMMSHHPDMAQDYRATIAMPSNWNFAYLTTVNELLVSYLTNSIVSQWLLITLPAKAQEYAAMAEAAAMQISQLLLTRKRPIRRASSGSGDGDLWDGSKLWVGNVIWGQ